MENCRISPFDHNSFIGYVSYVSPLFTKVHFPSSTLLNQFHYAGQILNAGLVGNYVAIEGENYGFLGKIIELSLPEKERLTLNEEAFNTNDFHPTGKIEVLLSFDYFKWELKKGLNQYPTIGSKVYVCSEGHLADFLKCLGEIGDENSDTTFDIATLATGAGSNVKVSPQSLFGRHCAIVGTTGGGKSFTVARLLEEVAKHKGKAILLDATGEYESLSKQSGFDSIRLSSDCYFHYSKLKITDFFVLFRPSEQVQLPKLQEAIKHLKLVEKIVAMDETSRSTNDNLLLSYIKSNHFIELASKPRKNFITAIKEHPECESLDGNFDISWLHYQIHSECVFQNDQKDIDKYGILSERDLGNCQSLITRILFVIKNKHIVNVFGIDKQKESNNEFSTRLNSFLTDSTKNVLRLSLEDVPFETNIREILVNAIGRNLLEKARDGNFREPNRHSLITFIDEAHQFLNKRIKGEFAFDVELNSFEQISKECRKYGLFLVLATQMPRDIPIGTLSQMGTFITHRLINQQDKETIENACSASNRNTLSFLPNLGAGEAVLMGVEFPIPVIVKIKMPTIEPDLKTPKVI